MSDQQLETLRPEKPQEDIIDFKTQLFDIIRGIQNRIADLEALPDGAIEVKSDTGDFATADSWDGRTVLNTVDNNLQILEGGAWRELASW